MSDPQSSITFLFKAVENGRIDVLRSILSELEAKSKSTFANVVDKTFVYENGNLMHFVTQEGDVDALRTLLASGANPCIQNEKGKTPFQLAQREDVRKVYVHELLQAIAHSKLGRICQLISSGVPINSIDEPHTKNTTLHWAACFGNEDVVRILCDGGCSANVKNVAGDTPLHDAVRRCDLNVVKKLLLYNADPDVKNNRGENCFDLANKKRREDVVQCLNLHKLTTQRSGSVSSLLSQDSVLSESLPTVQLNNNNNNNNNNHLNNKKLSIDLLDKEEALSFRFLEPDHWYDLLWPRPQRLILSESLSTSESDGLTPNGNSEKFDFKSAKSPSSTIFSLRDRRLKIFLLVGSDIGDSDFDRLWRQLHPRLMDLRLIIELEYPRLSAGDFCSSSKFSNNSSSYLICGVFPHKFKEDDSYRLKVETSYVELTAKNLRGLWYGLITFLQSLRVSDSYWPKLLQLPLLRIDDWPDTKYRAILVDFTGCRTYNLDTLRKIATDLIYSTKANQMILNFEVRVQDHAHFLLPYNGAEFYHLNRFCSDLGLNIVPGLDLNCEELDSTIGESILEKFFQNFDPAEFRFFYFGGNLCKFFGKNLQILCKFAQKCSLIYLSTKKSSEDDFPILPPQCLLIGFADDCDEKFVSKTDHRLQGFQFSNCKSGCLCPSPDEILRNARLAHALSSRKPEGAGGASPLSIAACDLATGCEIVPRSFAHLSELAVLGAAWNARGPAAEARRDDFYALPLVAAYHAVPAGPTKGPTAQMAALFREILALGRLERQITKMTGANLSIFVQLILNPNFIDLESLTPVAFKKVRLELQNSLKVLVNLKKELPYNFEMALMVAEVQLIVELMILVSKMGQSLCLIGSNPNNHLGSNYVNVGVSNLPLTSRTDLSNKLLEIRSQFQHAWLSRNLPSTLQNALKIFDNLFKMLLPPSLQEYGEKLL